MYTHTHTHTHTHTIYMHQYDHIRPPGLAFVLHKPHRSEDSPRGCARLPIVLRSMPTWSRYVCG